MYLNIYIYMYICMYPAGIQQPSSVRRDSTSVTPAGTPQFCSPPSVSGNPGSGNSSQVTVHPNPAATMQHPQVGCVCMCVPRLQALFQLFSVISPFSACTGRSLGMCVCVFNMPECGFSPRFGIE